MRRHILVIALLLLVAGAYAGCSKEYITNNITESSGETGIIGRVTPGEPGILVSAWQAAKIREVTADDSGYYAILGLATGLYEVHAIASSGLTAVTYGVRVAKGSASTVNIHLDAPSLPALFTGISPADGSRRVSPMNSRILLGTREPLDKASLTTSVIITPPVAGQWSSGAYVAYPEGSGPEDIIDDIIVVFSPNSTSYTFEPDTQFAPATEYAVRILPSLRLGDGSVWGDSLRFSFTTDSLRVICLSVSSGRCGDTVIALRAFQLTLRFNSFVNIDSVNKAASITPDIEGFWYYAAYYSTPRQDIIQFYYTQPPSLRAEQTYTLALSGTVGLTGSVALGRDFEAALLTEPVRVVQILPWLGDAADVSTWVEVEFNAAMDPPTAETAVTVRMYEGPAIAGSKVWLNDYKLTFRPDAPLTPGRVYEVYVDNTAVSLLGDTLRVDAYSFFHTMY